MERRDFIKLSCSACAILGAGLFSSELTSCASIPVYRAEIRDRRVELPLSLFSESAVRIIRPEQFPYDIAVQKENDGTYKALLLRCTHADNQLNYTGSGFLCSLHGSSYDIRGAVTRGPAQHPLQRLSARVENDRVVIALD